MSARPEILAPAGDFVCLQAALDAGADAVYFGLGTFNMRARSGVNFTEADLPEIAARCDRRKVKRYLTLNAIMFEGEREAVERTIVAAQPYVDAFIVSDWGVIALCRKHGATFHVSTQMSTSNSAAVKFLASQGAARVVLARECTLAEVAAIVNAVRPTEIECFVHGAQCVAESGRCLMSHDAFGKSACRGECHQPCRRRFLVKAVDLYTDAAGKPAFIVEPHTVLSAKDASGKDAEVQPDGDNRWVCPLKEDTEFAKTYSDAIIALAERVAKYTVKDLSRNGIMKDVASESPAESILKKFSNDWAPPHKTATVTDAKVTDFYVLSDECFTCHVEFTFTLRTRRGNDYVYPTSYTFCVVKRKGAGKLYNITFN